MIQFLVRFLRHPVKNWLILRHPIAFLIQWVRVTNKPLAKVCVLNYEKSVKNRIWKNRICSACQNTYLPILFFCEKVCSVKKKFVKSWCQTPDLIVFIWLIRCHYKVELVKDWVAKIHPSFSQILHISPICTHKEMRFINFPFPYEDGSRAVMGVKCYVKYCRNRPSFQNLQLCMPLFLQNGHFYILK